MKKWSYAIILVGLCILFYPSVNNWLEDRTQNMLLEQAEAEAESVDPLDVARISSQAAVPDYEKISALLDEGDIENDADTQTEPSAPQDGEVLGLIRYDKLNIKLPIVEGATQENMKSAAVHVTGTGFAGAPDSNMAIAAHRAHKEGRLFNRLNEAKVGDTVEVVQGSQTYTYEIDNIQIVEPQDVWVLNPIVGQSSLTLITCDPLINPTHRLIVHAVLQP
ncbi:class D sortase [Saccharibacillus sp. JS10]|uniref:class D sortase n=1 Tax=Saccharibacillus sp. JS10 TaxID=2950552 RepID=UPI0021092DC7|nr:class D sortase [Saccharibacillus sp. JS10]MCQ4087520.1 class D sortase [Saccharibacillus sp. JS10]